jgi:hypothetical protein
VVLTQRLDDLRDTLLPASGSRPAGRTDMSIVTDKHLAAWCCSCQGCCMAGEPTSRSDDERAPSAGADASSGGDPEASAQDVKTQFRQALQRKQRQHTDGVAGSGPAGPKIHEAHGAVGGKRQFRRKSG